MSMSDAPSNGDIENSVDDASDGSSNGDDANGASQGDDGVRRGIVERGLFMVLFGFIGYFVFWAVILLALIQWIFTIINKEPNGDIGRFSANLSEYLSQITKFVGYASEEKPCPFAPFPKVDS